MNALMTFLMAVIVAGVTWLVSRVLNRSYAYEQELQRLADSLAMRGDAEDALQALRAAYQLGGCNSTCVAKVGLLENQLDHYELGLGFCKEALAKDYASSRPCSHHLALRCLFQSQFQLQRYPEALFHAQKLKSCGILSERSLSLIDMASEFLDGGNIEAMKMALGMLHVNMEEQKLFQAPYRAPYANVKTNNSINDNDNDNDGNNDIINGSNYDKEVDNKQNVPQEETPVYESNAKDEEEGGSEGQERDEEESDMEEKNEGVVRKVGEEGGETEAGEVVQESDEETEEEREETQREDSAGEKSEIGGEGEDGEEEQKEEEQGVEKEEKEAEVVGEGGEGATEGASENEDTEERKGEEEGVGEGSAVEEVRREGGEPQAAVGGGGEEGVRESCITAEGESREVVSEKEGEESAQKRGEGEGENREEGALGERVEESGGAVASGEGVAAKEAVEATGEMRESGEQSSVEGSNTTLSSPPAENATLSSPPAPPTPPTPLTPEERALASSRAYYTLALAYLSRGDYVNAFKQLDKTLKKAPRNRDALFTRASLYLERGELGKGVGDLKLLYQEVDRGNETVRGVLQGVLRESLGGRDWDRAGEVWEVLGGLQGELPLSLPLASALSQMYRAKGQGDRALEVWREVEKRGEGEAPPLLLAELYEERGEVEEAVRYLERAKERGEASDLHIGELFMRRGEYPRALPYLSLSLPSLLEREETLPPKSREREKVRKEIGKLYRSLGKAHEMLWRERHGAAGGEGGDGGAGESTPEVVAGHYEQAMLRGEYDREMRRFFSSLSPPLSPLPMPPAPSSSLSASEEVQGGQGEEEKGEGEGEGEKGEIAGAEAAVGEGEEVVKKVERREEAREEGGLGLSPKFSRWVVRSLPPLPPKSGVRGERVTWATPQAVLQTLPPYPQPVGEGEEEGEEGEGEGGERRSRQGLERGQEQRAGEGGGRIESRYSSPLPASPAPEPLSPFEQMYQMKEREQEREEQRREREME